MPQGYVALVLHAHLPYVRHPELSYSLEEKWLFEGITETYIPLIATLQSLVRDNVDFALTISLSPTLISMLEDEFLQNRYLNHLKLLMELADKEVERTSNQPAFHHLAQMYRRIYYEAYDLYYRRYRGRLMLAFQELDRSGKVEFITCASTHGYLPLLDIHREVLRAQVQVAVELFRRYFGRHPQGFWLPECGYAPGDDEILAEYGIKYFIVDTHGILYAVPRPRYGTFAPIRCPSSGVHAFGRDVESSLQVWSAQEGYPGDFDYREFYRDIGYDLDYDYIKPYIHPQGFRIDTGFKYYRITGKSNYKEPYVPEWARRKAEIHAGNFMFNRERQIEYLAQHMDRAPIVVSPYDAELFGHWWFEGPLWLNFLFRKAASEQNIFRFTTPSRYLDLYPHNQPSTPCMSSWGNQGYNDVWLEGSNDWIYRHLHHAAKQMVYLATNYPRETGTRKRALDQAARELLLAQASDWAFIMKTGTMTDYAIRRTKTHIARFLRLERSFLEGNIDERWLADIEEKDNIFPFLHYSVFSS